MNEFVFTVEAEDSGKRTDVYLSEKTEFTRSHIKTAENYVTVNGKSVKVNKVLKTGDEVRFNPPIAAPVEAKPNPSIPLEIVYEDDDLAVINKQQGLTVHAGAGTDDDTLVNALLSKLNSLSGINGELRPGIVHRIDKNTSGLLVVAKNDAAHVSLSKQIESKTCKRIYYALLEGVLKENSGEITTFIGRDPKDRKKMAVTKFGRTATTDFKVVKRYKEYTSCEFSLQTGRTHQIRVHAKYIKHPVVGDKEYGYKNQKFNLGGQLLHAGRLTFTHPTKNVKMTFTAPLPDYFEKVLKSLR